MNGGVKITKPADPKKIEEYKRKHPSYKPKQRIDKMGRKIGERVAMTEERAKKILDMREAKRLNHIYRDDA